jgi:hypothetical protein
MTTTTRRIAAGALGATGVLHLALAPEYLAEQAYVGVLFVLGGLTCAVLAARLWRADEAVTWILGALTAAGMFAGFVLSRTVGLPGFHEAEWEASGLVSLLLEGGFVALAAAALRPVGRRPEPAPARR